jgi:DNA topoisomerase-1
MANLTLVVVESPGKVKKIQHILGDSYIVTASVGHIIDLAKKTISVDIENNFEPIYEIIDGKNKIVSELKKLLNKCSKILIATDEDREGEMIAWSIAYVLKLKNPDRITFNSITEQAILNSIKNPRKINQPMVDAQKTRRILDRIVGYELSPILSKNIGQYALSAGRVQSVVVKLILEKELEIENHLKNLKTSYYKVKGYFYDLNKKIFKTDLYEIKAKAKSKNKFNGSIANIISKPIIIDLYSKFSKSKFILNDITEKESLSSPSAPFTTSTLQQEAQHKLGFQIQRTMMAAQHLYEAGHITYMRTDSVQLSPEAFTEITSYVITTFGKSYSNPKQYTMKVANTQEAHEAIRPTHIDIIKINEIGKISSDEIKLYNLIWKRTVSSQMSSAIFNINTTFITISLLENYYFSTDVKTIKFDGFLKVYNITNIESSEIDTDTDNKSFNLPKINSELYYQTIQSEESYQNPPSRYNEATLVSKLDPQNLNIGRPSTYAAICIKIQEKEYIKKCSNEGISKDICKITLDEKMNISEELSKIFIGKDQNRLCPTHMGRITTEFLETKFKEIMDYQFTAQMELDLDKIAENKILWTDCMKKFYTNFHQEILKNKLDSTKSTFIDKDKKSLGIDPTTSYEIIATIRKFGPVVQMINKDVIINTAPIKPPLSIMTITLESALELLSYPKNLGSYEKKSIMLNRGKFGLYVKYSDQNISLTKLGDINEEDISLDMIINLIKENNAKYLWKGTDGKISYTVMTGPYGNFINKIDRTKKTAKPLNISLPTDIDPTKLTIESIKKIIEEGKVKKYNKSKSKTKI